MTPDIYTEQYKFEWEHRAYLQSATNIAIVIVTIIGGGLVSISRLYNFSESTGSSLIASLLALSLLSLCFAALSIFRAMHGFEYARVPTPTKIEGWKEDLTKWHIEYGSLSEIDSDLHDGY